MSHSFGTRIKFPSARPLPGTRTRCQRDAQIGNQLPAECVEGELGESDASDDQPPAEAGGGAGAAAVGSHLTSGFADLARHCAHTVRGGQVNTRSENYYHTQAHTDANTAVF